jgi:NMD protein affecting ribosome stability and mRNA decay
MENIYLSGQYFEAKIQLRPFNKKVYDFILKQVARRKDVFITKEIKCKTGMDIYLTNQRFSRSLGKKLKDNFKGELKITRTLHSRDRLRSKLRYRATVLFRLK